MALEVSGNVQFWKTKFGKSYRVSFNLLDALAQEYILEDINAVVSIIYGATGKVAYATQVDEYFGNSNGSFSVQFSNLPDYDYSKVRIELTSPVSHILDLDIEDDNEIQIVDQVHKMNEPLGI